MTLIISLKAMGYETQGKQGKQYHNSNARTLARYVWTRARTRRDNNFTTTSPACPDPVNIGSNGPNPLAPDLP